MSLKAKARIKNNQGQGPRTTSLTMLPTRHTRSLVAVSTSLVFRYPSGVSLVKRQIQGDDLLTKLRYGYEMRVSQLLGAVYNACPLSK